VHKIAFNVGQVVLGLTAATAIYDALASGPATEPTAWAAAVLAMAACFVINDVAVALAIALARGERLLRVLLPPMRVNLLQWAGNGAVGIIAAVVWHASRPGVFLLLVPTGLLYLAYRGWLRSLREREQMAQMARAAGAIAGEGDISRRLPAADRNGSLADLTETLNRMLERLETAFQRERRFIREASHELRTPVTIGRGHLEVLSRDADPAELEQTVALLLDEFDRMGRILEDMTVLARSERPGFVRPTDVELAPFLADVAAKAKPILNGRLRTTLPPEGAAVRADPQRLTQACLNLLQNAAVHARGDSPVELRAVEEEGGWRVEVADRGYGVPRGEEEAVFRPFYQAWTSGGGSGLGLPLVRTIAEAHGGSAGVEDTPGGGATFWVRVPA
jgi:signal transduction histidine kinase